MCTRGNIIIINPWCALCVVLPRETRSQIIPGKHGQDKSEHRFQRHFYLSHTHVNNSKIRMNTLSKREILVLTISLQRSPLYFSNREGCGYNQNQVQNWWDSRWDKRLRVEIMLKITEEVTFFCSPMWTKIWLKHLSTKRFWWIHRISWAHHPEYFTSI